MDDWVVACGGNEPVMKVWGQHYQYYWNRFTGEHAYYWQEGDMFLGYGNPYLPVCLGGLNPGDHDVTRQY